jgi:hypothetical protein
METRKPRTYFEQVPIEVVKKLVEAGKAKEIDEASETEEIGKATSDDQVQPEKEVHIDGTSV